MTEINKAVWTVKKGIYELMKAGKVYNSRQIVELSEGKFPRQQASTHLRSLWTMNLLEVVPSSGQVPSYLKLPGMKYELVGNYYKVIREAE